MERPVFRPADNADLKVGCSVVQWSGRSSDRPNLAYPRAYLSNQSIVRCQASSAAALL